MKYIAINLLTLITIYSNDLLFSNSFIVPSAKQTCTTIRSIHEITASSSSSSLIITTTTKDNTLGTSLHFARRSHERQRLSSSKLYVKQEGRNQLEEEEIVFNAKNENGMNRVENMQTVDDGSTKSIATTTNEIKALQEKLFLGIEPTPEILAIMSIYFVEGALGLARLAQTFYLKDTLHLGPAELSALTGLFALPWTIKPLYGFLSDGLPLFGYRRRSYLILCGLLGSFCYTALGMNFFGFFDGSGAAIVENANTMMQATIASFVISSGCIAFSDVVADGIVVQRTRDSDDPKVAGKVCLSRLLL